VTVDSCSGYPCRVSLADVQVGESIMLDRRVLESQVRAVTAVARELSAFMWAIAREVKIPS
jgi:hypothetical protein